MVVRESDEGAVLVNETLTQSRTQPVNLGNQHLFDLTVLIEHLSHPDVIIITVSEGNIIYEKRKVISCDYFVPCGLIVSLLLEVQFDPTVYLMGCHRKFP